MLYIKNGEWALPLHKVIYKQHGETLEQHTHDKQWWKDFAEKWDHTEVIEFKDITYSDEQTARLEEIKPYIEEGFEYYASRYIMDGLFPCQLDGEDYRKIHPFELLKLSKEKDVLEDSVMELTMFMAGGYNV